MLKVHLDATDLQDGDLRLTLDELAREGARRMLVAALEAEVTDYIERHRGERDERGHALVARNGRARPRKVTLGCGTVEVVQPRINDRRVVGGERQRFTSTILPPYMRRRDRKSTRLNSSHVAISYA